MVVTDYLRTTNSPSIVVPPFLTGPLGLVPSTKVYIGLIETGAGGDLIIRPFRQGHNLMQLSCTTHDQPGVLVRLIEAITALGVNIVNADSTAINHLNRHQCELILDWTGSKYPDRCLSNASLERHYRDYQGIVPVTVERNVALFNSIVENCADVLEVHEVNGVQVPLLTLREIDSPKDLEMQGPVTISRHSVRSFHIEIPVPIPLLTRLCLKSGIRKDEGLHYILLAETASRTLRAFFPSTELLPRLVHVAFGHLDAPGVLTAILRTLASASFSTLTSLVPKEQGCQKYSGSPS